MMDDTWLGNVGLEARMKELSRLGLNDHVAELEAQGYTAVFPEKLASREFTQRLREAILRVAETRTGVKTDLETGASHGGAGGIQRARVRLGDGPDIDWHWHMVFEDRVFEETLLNPTVQALVGYMLGGHAKLSADGAMLRGPSNDPDARPQGMHTDAFGIPPPFPPYSQVCNATWILTDYTAEGGATRFVPGSHRLCRHPMGEEALAQAVPLEAPAGSLLIWHGNTWHTRTNPRHTAGMRISYSMLFCRQYMMTQQLYNQVAPKEVLDRNPPAFSTLMGLHDPYGVYGGSEHYHANFRQGYVNFTTGRSQYD